MKALLDQARSINDEWQRALLLSSFLESKGLHLPSTATVDRVEAYTAQAGDTWESVAKEQLGDPSLWPILWLLNAEEASSQSDLSPGRSILVPRGSRE
jgi:nucleoid-associated protein YgaU